MPVNVLKIKWNMRYHEVKDDRDRLLYLMNDFFLAHKIEIEIGLPWYRNFYEKVMNRYEELCEQVAV